LQSPPVSPAGFLLCARNATLDLTLSNLAADESSVEANEDTPEEKMRSLILLGLGAPIPLILLLAFCTHHF
jgi:hypothetical protein